MHLPRQRTGLRYSLRPPPYHLLLYLLLLLACQPAQPAPEGDGIYYWRTTFELDTTAQRQLVERGISNVYLRLFDLDRRGGTTAPRGALDLPDSLPRVGELTFTPVVFITERVFRREEAPEKLAGRLAGAIDRFVAPHPALRNFQTIQIDYDWTPGTRDRYFRFLETLRTHLPGKEIVVTIRLHQYRERKNNGTPPADRGVLMAYNVAPAHDPKTRNAIYDRSLVAGYLSADAYPLPLDGALPLFRWSSAFRAGRFIGLTANTSAFSEDYATPIGDGRWHEIQRDTAVGRRYLRPGDLLRQDGILRAEELKAAEKLLRKRANVRQIVYFDWQPDTEDRWPVLGQ